MCKYYDTFGVLWSLCFVRPWKMCAFLWSIWNTVRLCAEARWVSVAVDIFRATFSTSRQLMFASRSFFQQKRNRCAVMSIVDYSCNIARKKMCAHTAWMDCATLSIHPSILQGVQLLGGGGQTKVLVADQQRRQRNNRPHPFPSPHICCHSLSKHRGPSPTRYQL